MSTKHPSVLQLDVSGHPTRWIDFETAAYYISKDLIGWVAGDNQFTIYGGNNRLTGLQSSMDINTIIAVKGKMGDRGIFRVPALNNKALFRRDHNICAYCGGQFAPSDLTRDHIRPSSKGGKDVWMNVVTSCGGCNKHKDDRTPEEAGMMLRYLPYVPNRSEYLVLMNGNILDDQLQFLLARVTKDSRLLHQHQ